MDLMIVDSALRRIEDASLEVVERKGLGHPDTLTDRFAEAFVTEYVAWSREHLGGPPHHWVDKCVLIGGESFNTFGESLFPVTSTGLRLGTMTPAAGRRQPAPPWPSLRRLWNFVRLASALD